MARPKEGPRAPLFYGALALALAATAQAQTVEVSDLERCAGLETQAAKLACFEAIVAESAAGAEPADEPPPDASDPALADTEPAVPALADEDLPTRESEPPPDASTSEQAAVQGEGPSPLAEPAAAVDADVAVPISESRSESAAADAATVTTGATGAPAADTPPPAPRTPDDEFGREHLSSRGEDEAAVLNATVIDVGKDRHGALIFYLDNGQVWRQMEARYFPYPRNGQFDVVISTGVMGEYRLQVGGTGRKVTIRRTK